MARIYRSLDKKLALVTGGGSGIGRSTCQLLAREGATIIALDINVVAAEATIKSLSTSTDHMAFCCDVSSLDSVRKAVDSVLKRYNKPPTIIVNAAGIFGTTMFLDTTEEEFDRLIAVNLKGTFLVTQIFAKAQIEAKLPASIINISSIAGEVAYPGQSAYSTNKSAIITLTKVVAKELAKYNIRVNSILPGLIDTPMILAMPEDVQTAFLQTLPFNRKGTPDEVAELIVFLASDKSSYMSGGAIKISGGY